MSQLIPSTGILLQVFKDHADIINAVAVFPDRRRIVIASFDKTVHLRDLKTGVVLKKIEHRSGVRVLAISPDGQTIASDDVSGKLIIWHGETGEPLTQPIQAHSAYIHTLDFSPDGTVLATGSKDATAKLWSTKTWQMQGNPIQCTSPDWGVHYIRYSPSGEHFAIATDLNIEIYSSGTRKRVAKFKAHTGCNDSLAWMPDGTRLLSGGNEKDPTIREWDTSTRRQVGDPWTGHTNIIWAIAIHPAGTHVASASHDCHIRLWRLSDRRTIAIFQRSLPITCATFTMDGKHIFSGGHGSILSKWGVPKSILAINAAARNACIAGDLSTAEELFTQEIEANTNNYTSYANCSFVIRIWNPHIMARKNDWDHALDDAIKSVAIQPSLTGYISEGIALCGKRQVRDARTAFDLAFMFTNEYSNIVHFLLLVKAIAIFNADQHEEAILRVQKLAAACPNNDTLACRVVETYLCVQLGINALNGARHDEAADYFTTAINSATFSSTAAIGSIYKDLVVLFGWDLKSLWQNAHQKRCDVLRRAGRHEEAMESYRHMMDMSDENTKASCFDWSNGKSRVSFTQEYIAPYITNGDAALAASDYDRAIKLYSAAIELHFASDTIFANRSKARSEKMLWEDALLDVQKVIELNPSSHVGALYGAQRYDEAIAAFQMMLAKLDSAHGMQIRICQSPEAEGVIRKVIDVELNTAPLRLLNTATGLLCEREAQISAFKRSTEYNELLLALTMKHADIRMEHITEVVATYFRCAMLSHRWEGTEPLLHDIRDKVVYELEAAGGLVKLQSFCKLAPLTAVYLSDVPPSSEPGALAKSAWNTRGWTVPEFLAPKVIRFYQQDWSLYLDDESPNHKESVKIMDELEDATGIDARALAAFQPGMRDAREKLQWASTRVTTVPEDIAYPLFGIFGVQLPILYGENKQRALGRLLQEIVAQSGDITALDWVGPPSTFNSCLPADISSYAAPLSTLPSLSEDEILTAVSSLRNTMAVESALRLYEQLENMSAPRFANCRLRLPCIAFRVMELRRRRGPAHDTHLTYGVKADGLHDLQITTEETLNQFSRARPARQTLFLVRPWDRRLLELPKFVELPAFADDDSDAESLGDWSEPESPLDDSPGGSPVERELGVLESHTRALRLMVRLGQLFSAFLLAQQPAGEYKRIASDHDIVAQVKDANSVHNKMDVRTLEIL
ncbi:hypothetical protein DFH29DRAFT_1075813 [Suillus ampliporus]|nr:hypothetical protein DFH29DRAFT_1075813 [Suillus ampliporus]